MSFWNLIKVVAYKELLDGFRDRRALMSALTFPLLGPLMITVMLSVISSEEEIEGLRCRKEEARAGLSFRSSANKVVQKIVSVQQFVMHPRQRCRCSDLPFAKA